MKVINKKEALLLLIIDILIFVFSLWLSLCIRFWELPSSDFFLNHLIPFGILFIIWLFVFFIAGLYEKHTTIFKKKLPIYVLKAQLFNSFLAVFFFYFVPYFGITPKIILFIYILISLILILIWRIFGQKIFNLKSKDKAMIIGYGKEMQDLILEIDNNPRYGLEFVSIIDLKNIQEDGLSKKILEDVNSRNVSVIVLDLDNDFLKKNRACFYNLLFSQITFISISNLYEEIFDRVPLSLINYDWFLENISLKINFTYSLLKRITDIIISFFFGLFSLVFYPFVFLLIKLEDQGPIFITQNRIGKDNKLIKIIKFRTMSFNDNEEKKDNLSFKKVNKITKVGGFLRKSRLDELPQLWNVWRGDLSLIGPRPELPALAETYEREVPYYHVRHLIKPGLSGWAQLYHKNHPHQGVNTEETKNKLSYDLYYIKNRSLLLDFKIILKTIKSLLSRAGR